jgi:hypothetical protein
MNSRRISHGFLIVNDISRSKWFAVGDLLQMGEPKLPPTISMVNEGRSLSG